MGALAIIGGIAAAIALILICPIQALLSYDGKFSLKIGVPFLKFSLLKDLSEKLDDPTLSQRQKRKIVKKIQKQENKAEKKAQKKKEKALLKQKKGKKKTPTHTAAETLQKRKSKGALSDLRFLLRAGGILAEKFKKKLTVKIKRLDIVIASDDAAKTAYLYGAVSQGVAYFFAALDAYAKLKIKNKHFHIRADFLKDKCDFEGEILLSISVGGVISLVFSALTIFMKQAFRKKAPSQAAKVNSKGSKP